MKIYKVYICSGHSESPKSYSREDEIDADVSQKLQDRIMSDVKSIERTDITAVVIPFYLKTLTNKINFANTRNADLYISLHCNYSDTNKEAKGFNIFHDTIETAETPAKVELAIKSKRLAELVSGHLITAGFNPFGMAVLPDSHAAVKDLGVCRLTTMPSILIELGFLSNPEDAENLEKDDIQNKMAEAIKKGIYNYLL